MSQKEDLERIYQYGRGPYLAALKALPSYAKVLARAMTDYNARSWIDSPFRLPKFTTDEWEARRVAYQAKFGNYVVMPGFSDIIHWKLPTRISTEDMAAHRLAQKKGLPSPLTPDQLMVLTYRKARFLRGLATPTPAWLRAVGAVQNALDNAEDALVTLVVLGRIAARLAPRALGRAVPILGWALLGSDIINLANMFTWASFASKGAKRNVEGLVDKNPFHKKAWARRASKLTRVFPSFGEILEVAQTTDQLFGVGLCLGAIVGWAEDVVIKVIEGTMYGVAVTIDRLTPVSNTEAAASEGIEGSLILDSFWDPIDRDDHLRSYVTMNLALQQQQSWWERQDPLETIHGLRDIRIKPHPPKNLATIDMLQEAIPDYEKTLVWPHLETPDATIEEILFNYAPRIKESLQIHALRWQNDFTAFVAFQNVTDFVHRIVGMNSDDGQVMNGRSAFATTAINMCDQIYIIPPTAPRSQVDQLGEIVGDYERRTTNAPDMRDLAAAGEAIGIEWMRTFPRIAFQEVAEAFPQWQAIQDQVAEIFAMD